MDYPNQVSSNKSLILTFFRLLLDRHILNSVLYSSPRENVLAKSHSNPLTPHLFDISKLHDQPETLYSVYHVVK